MKKILFSLALIFLLAFSVTAVSAHTYTHKYYNNPYETYEKKVTKDYWGKTVEIHRNSPYESFHYYKSTDNYNSIQRGYDYWGYKPYYGRYRINTDYYQSYYYHPSNYKRGDYYRWRY